MDDRLRVGKPPRFVTSHSGQLTELSLLPSARRKMSTDRPKCGDALRLWINVGVPSLTRAIPELFRDEFLMIKRYTNLRLRLLYFTFIIYFY